MGLKIKFKNQDGKLRTLDTGTDDFTEEGISKVVRKYNSDEGKAEIEEITGDKVCSMVMVAFDCNNKSSKLKLVDK